MTVSCLLGKRYLPEFENCALPPNVVRFLPILFTDTHGEVMPTVCTPCRNSNLVCRVHVQSGRCNNCNHSNNSQCDIRVTALEFSKLSKERVSLLKRMDEACAATVAAQDAVVVAQELLSKALSKEMRLHRQRDYNGRRAGEAIAVEERGIEEQEAEETWPNWIFLRSSLSLGRIGL